jgi:hypothetical protein
MKKIIGKKVKITDGYWKGKTGVIVNKHNKFDNSYVINIGDEYICTPIIHALDMKFI